MNCVIPGANLKILNKVCQTLSKIGDYLYIETRADSLQISTVNNGKTAFAKFIFNATFFTDLNLTSISNESISCKIPMKSNVFKSKGPKDKKVECCKLELNEESILVVTIMYSHDLSVRHEINLVEKELINVDYNPEKLSKKISFGKVVLQRILNNFQSRDEDMSMEFKPNKCIVRNYDSSNNEITHDLRSQIFLKPADFDEYKIGDETTTITIGFRSFRAAANFCENFSLNGILNFDCGGKPVIFSIQDLAFEGNFIFASAGFASENLSRNGSSQETDELKLNNQNINLNSPTILENFEMDFEENEMEVEVMSNKSESPRTKLIKLVFGRCFESEFDDNKGLGRKILSDTDSD
ncbi:cell cycle checkpoint control protein RAD9A [Onthophagus taurus]|uniref:cell cycle checkpoint control protein RAD9A n=1 Tax=Onthophagus taurus TaxID=166361 RepID=UPI000C1FF1A9|nr:cell cycle checkpoint control protein RAD9A-like [Onthophagus taurus]